MAMDEQVIDVPFTGGFDTSNDDALVQPPEAISLIDGIFRDKNTISTRDGVQPVSTTLRGGGDAFGSALRTAQHKGATLVESTNGFHSILPSQGGLHFIDSLRRAVPELSWPPVDSGATVGIPSVSAANANGINFAAWDCTGGIRWAAWDTTTNNLLGGQFLTDPTAVQTLGMPKVVTDGVSFHLYYIRDTGAARAVERQTFLATAAGCNPGSSTIIGTNVFTFAARPGSFQLYDVFMDLGKGSFMADDGANVRIGILNTATGALSSSRNIAVGWASLTGASTCMSSGGYAFYFMAPILGAGQISWGAWNGTTLTTGGVPVAVDFQGRLTSYPDPSGNNQAYVVYDNAVGAAAWAAAAQDQVYLRYIKTDSTAATLRQGLMFGSCSLAGRLCILTTGEFLLPVAYRSQPGGTSTGYSQATPLLVDARDSMTVASASYIVPRVLARGPSGEGFVDDSFRFVMPDLRASSTLSNVYEWFFTRYASTAVIADSVNYTPWRLQKMNVDLSAGAQLGQVELQDLTLLCGANPLVYDGQALFEEGFLHAPVISSVTMNGGGGSMSAGSYSLIAVYEHIDNRGNVWQSPPSAAFPITAAANDKFTAVVSTLRVTKRQNVSIVFYLTLVSGTIYYRWPTTYASSTTADKVTTGFIGTVTDAVRSGSSTLYTLGGVLPNTALPPHRHATIHQRRIFVSSCDDHQEVGFTTQPSTKEAWAYSPYYRMRVPGELGRVVGTSSMDDKLAFLCEGGIAATYGEGPVRTGLLGTYAEPLTIVKTNGAMWNAGGSIVVTDSGTWFQTTDGSVRLLNRGMQIEQQQSGAARGSEIVGLITTGFPLRAAFLPTYRQVVFFGFVGYTFIFDERWRQWSIASLPGFVGRYGAQVIADGGNVGTGFYLLGLDNLSQSAIYSWSTANQTDYYALGAVQLPITAILETGWLRMSGIAGFERLKRIGVLVGGNGQSTTLAVTVYKNYVASAPSSSGSITATIQTGDYGVLEHHNADQKGAAFKVKLALTAPSTARAAMTGMSLTMGVKKGILKQTSARRG